MIKISGGIFGILDRVKWPSLCNRGVEQFLRGELDECRTTIKTMETVHADIVAGLKSQVDRKNEIIQKHQEALREKACQLEKKDDEIETYVRWMAAVRKTLTDAEQED